MSTSVLWAERPDEDRDESREPEVEGAIDETFAARRLRRWLKGMFGGQPVSDGGPAEEGRGNPEVPPTSDRQ